MLFYIKELFKYYMQIYIKEIKNQILPLILAKFRGKALIKIFKLKNPDLYDENLYIKHYYFCR